MNKHWTIVDLDRSFDGIGPIKSVRRLSDGKIFTVGQYTLDGPINSFTVKESLMYVLCGKVNLYGYDGVSKCLRRSLESL